MSIDTSSKKQQDKEDKERRLKLSISLFGGGMACGLLLALMTYVVIIINNATVKPARNLNGYQPEIRELFDEFYRTRQVEASQYVDYAELQRLRQENDRLSAENARLTTDLDECKNDLKLETTISAAYKDAYWSDYREHTAALLEAERNQMPSYDELIGEIDSSRYRTTQLMEGDYRIWAIKTKGLPEYFTSYILQVSPHTGQLETTWVSSHGKLYVEDEWARDDKHSYD